MNSDFSSKPKVSFVIVSYRSRQTIDAALAVLHESCRSRAVECIVVENASGDETPEHVRRNYPYVTMIESPKNLGFGRACNLGAEHASGAYIVFLNPDAVLQIDELEKLVEFMDDRPTVGICAPAIAGHVAGGLPTPGSQIRAAFRLGSAYSTPRRELIWGSAPFATDWLCGAVFLVRTSVFRDLGGFDPRFFMYFEETDLCVRTRAMGKEIWAVTTARAEHTGGMSSKNSDLTTQSGNVTKYYLESRFYYLRKHHGFLAAALAETADIAPYLAKELTVRLGLGIVESSGLKQRLLGGFLRAPRMV